MGRAGQPSDGGALSGCLYAPELVEGVLSEARLACYSVGSLSLFLIFLFFLYYRL